MTGMTNEQWPLLKRVLFRFAFIYFGLYIIIQNNGAFPFWEGIIFYPTQWLHLFVPWVGKNVPHLSHDITIFTNGSGDTTYDYVIVLCIFAISVLSVAVWSIIDR